MSNPVNVAPTLGLVQPQKLAEIKEADENATGGNEMQEMMVPGANAEDTEDEE